MSGANQKEQLFVESINSNTFPLQGLHISALGFAICGLPAAQVGSTSRTAEMRYIHQHRSNHLLGVRIFAFCFFLW